MNRRGFVLGTAATAGGAPLVQRALEAAGAGPGFHLGAVTYNTLKNFDVETIIRVLEGAGFEAVELRTTHKHGVEPSISQAERARVRRLFEKSKIRLVRRIHLQIQPPRRQQPRPAVLPTHRTSRQHRPGAAAHAPAARTQPVLQLSRYPEHMFDSSMPSGQP